MDDGRWIHAPKTMIALDVRAAVHHTARSVKRASLADHVPALNIIDSTSTKCLASYSSLQSQSQSQSQSTVLRPGPSPRSYPPATAFSFCPRPWSRAHPFLLHLAFHRLSALRTHGNGSPASRASHSLASTTNRFGPFSSPVHGREPEKQLHLQISSRVLWCMTASDCLLSTVQQRLRL